MIKAFPKFALLRLHPFLDPLHTITCNGPGEVRQFWCRILVWSFLSAREHVPAGILFKKNAAARRAAASRPKAGVSASLLSGPATARPRRFRVHGPWDLVRRWFLVTVEENLEIGQSQIRGGAAHSCTAPSGLGASAPQLCGCRDCVQRYAI